MLGGAPNGTLIVTTLNAYRALHVFTPLEPRDHVGFKRGVKRGLEGFVVNTVRSLGNNRLMPYWADALIAVAKPR